MICVEIACRERTVAFLKKKYNCSNKFSCQSESFFASASSEFVKKKAALIWLSIILTILQSIYHFEPKTYDGAHSDIKQTTSSLKDFHGTSS